MSSALEHPQCAHWITRRNRRCSSVVTQAGETYCSLHTPEALARAREQSAKALQKAADGKATAAAGHAPRSKYRRLESTHRQHPTGANVSALSEGAWSEGA